MYYLKCKHCNHLNEVKSEYLVVCGLCNRKLEDNYKDWKVKHPEKSFEDFQREVCLTEEQVKKGNMMKPTGKKGNKKGLIAGCIGGVLVILMVALVINGMKNSYDELYGDDATPVLEQQWHTGTYVQRGTEYEFKITLYTTGLKLYQFISSNKKGDDTARGVVRRIYDSLKISGHGTSETGGAE